MFWIGVIIGGAVGLFSGFCLTGWFMFLKLKKQLENPMGNIMGDVLNSLKEEKK